MGSVPSSGVVDELRLPPVVIDKDLHRLPLIPLLRARANQETHLAASARCRTLTRGGAGTTVTHLPCLIVFAVLFAGSLSVTASVRARSTSCTPSARSGPRTGGCRPATHCPRSARRTATAGRLCSGRRTRKKQESRFTAEISTDIELCLSFCADFRSESGFGWRAGCIRSQHTAQQCGGCSTLGGRSVCTKPAGQC